MRQGILDDRAMTLALHALSSETLPCPGIVLALGFGGRTDCIEWIHKTLDRALADSDVAHACALALDWLRDTASRNSAVASPTTYYPLT